MSKANQDIIDLLGSTSETPPAPPQPGKEHRREPRFYVKWQTVVFVDAQSQHYGFIKDISVRGAALFLDRNLQSREIIKLHIHVPPSHISRAARTIAVYGKIIYSNHDSRELLFRTGVSFLKFDSEHDPVFLETYLANYQAKIF